MKKRKTNGEIKNGGLGGEIFSGILLFNVGNSSCVTCAKESFDLSESAVRLCFASF